MMHASSSSYINRLICLLAVTLAAEAATRPPPDGATLDYYRKLRVRVETLDGDVLAWLYVLNAYEGGLPSARNLGLLADTAEKAGAPADYVAEIRARPCDSVGG